MNYFVKYKFAIWTVIILSIMVLSVVGTMVYLRLQGPPFPKNDREERRHQAMQAFWKDLNLNPDQENQMKVLKDQFFLSSKGISDSLEAKRQRLLDELAKPLPDTTVLFGLAKDMGQLQTLLKRKTIIHLMSMRTFCTNEQIQKLKQLSGQMIRREGPPAKRRGEPRQEEK